MPVYAMANTIRMKLLREEMHKVHALIWALRGKTPVEVLREKPSPDVLDRLYLLAQHAGKMGT